MLYVLRFYCRWRERASQQCKHRSTCYIQLAADRYYLTSRSNNTDSCLTCSTSHPWPPELISLAVFYANKTHRHQSQNLGAVPSGLRNICQLRFSLLDSDKRRNGICVAMTTIWPCYQLLPHWGDKSNPAMLHYLRVICGTHSVAIGAHYNCSGHIIVNSLPTTSIYINFEYKSMGEAYLTLMKVLNQRSIYSRYSTDSLNEASILASLLTSSILSRASHS